jgi:hypothetical protein
MSTDRQLRRAVTWAFYQRRGLDDRATIPAYSAYIFNSIWCCYEVHPQAPGMFKNDLGKIFISAFKCGARSCYAGEVAGSAADRAAKWNNSRLVPSNRQNAELSPTIIGARKSRPIAG